MRVQCGVFAWRADTNCWSYFQAIVRIVIVAVLVHALAEPVAGTGIAAPTFIPPLIAAAKVACGLVIFPFQVEKAVGFSVGLVVGRTYVANS